MKIKLWIISCNLNIALLTTMLVCK